MKPRADKFLYGAERENLMDIQGEVQRHKAPIEEDDTISDVEKSNRVLFLYTAVAFDEGYRAAIKQLKEDVGQYCAVNKKLKKHKKNTLHYTETEEVTSLMPLIKRRIKSKRMIKAHKELKGEDFDQTTFILAMAIHTGFEHGFMKGSSVEETAKWVAKDDERAEMLVSLFNDLFKEHMGEQV